MTSPAVRAEHKNIGHNSRNDVVPEITLVSIQAEQTTQSTLLVDAHFYSYLIYIIPL